MKDVTIVILILLALQGVAQTTAKPHKRHFSSINTLGLLAGGTGEGAAVQTINGMRYKNWNVGIGTGIDWYGIRSIPLVLDVRHSFTDKKYKPFVYANGGANFPWATGDAYWIGFTTIETNYKPAFCGELGLGYQVSFKNQTAFVMSAGYSFKEIKVQEESFSGIPGFAKTTSNYHYYYRRIAIKMGFSF